ncbi:hypothetical protein BD777DRAFT_130346 [Yarrowia lipolytica]|nr:hypothetical protein BD777DRAFT_130346 [Yarrowia lipolytica]
MAFAFQHSFGTLGALVQPSIQSTNKHPSSTTKYLLYRTQSPPTSNQALPPTKSLPPSTQCKFRLDQFAFFKPILLRPLY